MPRWILNFNVIFKGIKVKIIIFVFLPNQHLNEHIFALNYFCYYLQVYSVCYQVLNFEFMLGCIV